MPKKKSVRKKAVKKDSSRRLVRSTQRKINLVLKNLIFFLVLCFISYMFYSVSSSELYQTTFFLISLLLGFISFAFFIVLAILLVLKLMKK